ncbi:MAG: carboxypeptidase-like regulatory domain-containing protein [Bacteroidales bacterium]|nr:carboxypeptidase-like regulatory domain-containing protein [Bacteroidales bacterium]
MKNSLLIVSILLLIPILSFSQKKSFQGKVIDEKTKEAIPFVNIGVENRPLGTITDDRGFFSISNIKADNNLVFSCIGYKSKKLSFLELSNTKIISLTPQARELSEVTITGMTAKAVIKEALKRIDDNYYTSDIYLDVSYNKIGKNKDSIFFMTNLNGIYKHKGYDNLNLEIKPVYSNMQTINSEYSDFNIKQIDLITQLDYLKLRPNSFEYSMDIVYDSNNESSYMITVKNKNNKPVIIPFYVRVGPRITKFSINCNDFAITKIEQLYDVNSKEKAFNTLYYKWRIHKIYYVFNYTKYNGKYLISNVFFKHINEVFPKEGFEKIKEKYVVEEGINEYKGLFNINNIYFSESEFTDKRETNKEIKTFDELKEIDEFKILLMDDKEYSFQ